MTLTRDAFDVLGLTPRFDLTRQELDQRQRELGRTLHPDKFTRAPPAERRRALGEAIDVNEAHRALSDPIERSLLLCKRLGIDAELKEQPPAAFLMEIMDLREQLSQASEASDLDAVEALTDRIAERERVTLACIADGFASLLSSNGGSAGIATDKSFSSMAPRAAEDASLRLRHQLAELRYYRRFLDEARGILDELE